jgi:hypothetical protein
MLRRRSDCLQHVVLSVKPAWRISRVSRCHLLLLLLPSAAAAANCCRHLLLLQGDEELLDEDEDEDIDYEVGAACRASANYRHLYVISCWPKLSAAILCCD